MTNILIPTDFSANSLKIAEQAVQFLQREVNIILFHAYEMPFYYQDMVRNSRPPYHAILNDDFRQGCKQLKDQYPRMINKISFQYMQGNTNALFRNFAEANDIHLIVCPANFVYTKTHSGSLNPIPFFRKSRIPVLQDLSLMPKNITMPAMQAATAFATA